MLSLASTVFSRVFPELESRILIRTCQKLDDPSVKSILPRIMESWIAVISLVSDLTLAVSWVGTVSVVQHSASICSPARPRQTRVSPDCAPHHSPRARVGRTQNVGPRPAPPTPTSHCWLYAGSGALNSLAPAACWHWLYCVQCVYSPPLYCASLNTSSRHGYYQH